MSEPYFYLPMDEAMKGARDGEVDGDTLLRSMALHESWLVAGQTDDFGSQIGVIKKPNEGRILEVFSDREAVLALEREHGSEFTSSLLELHGFQWMTQVMELDVDRVNINPGSPNTVYYQRNQLDVIHAWGQLGMAEAALYYPERVQDHLNALISHSGYAVVIYGEDEEDGGLMLAPDSDDRRLGAVFTTFDAANDFVNTLSNEFEDDMRPVSMPPDEWIPMFARLDLDGLVFNPWSSLPSLAVNSGILEPLLKRLNEGAPS